MKKNTQVDVMEYIATVLLDLDSTVLSCESLEEVLRFKGLDVQRLHQIKEITEQGMSGKMDFLTSIKKRLELATITQRDVGEFAQRAGDYLTPGIAELIKDLKQQAVDVWIVSGALRDILLPVGKLLGIAADHLLGITLQWSAEGEYRGIDAQQPIHRSKWEGIQEISAGWKSPKIAVGDGMTDYELYAHQLVEHFIAFTQHVRRQAVLEHHVNEAHSVAELRQKLDALIPKVHL